MEGTIWHRNNRTTLVWSGKDHNQRLRPKGNPQKNGLFEEQFWGLLIVVVFDKI